MRHRKWLCKIEKLWISNISESNCTILMKIHMHNIYITHKIVNKSGADSSSRSREITIDLTFVSSGLLKGDTCWRVSDTCTLSDHCAIAILLQQSVAKRQHSSSVHIWAILRIFCQKEVPKRPKKKKKKKFWGTTLKEGFSFSVCHTIREKTFEHRKTVLWHSFTRISIFLMGI